MILGHTNNQMLFQVYAGFIESERNNVDLSIDLLN